MYNKKNNNGIAVERDPPGSGLYTAARPGVWRLKGGSLRPDDASQLPPLMLVRTGEGAEMTAVAGYCRPYACCVLARAAGRGRMSLYCSGRSSRLPKWFA